MNYQRPGFVIGISLYLLKYIFERVHDEEYDVRIRLNIWANMNMLCCTYEDI